MGLSLPKSNLIFLKKCLDKWVHFTVWNNARILMEQFTGQCGTSPSKWKMVCGDHEC